MWVLILLNWTTGSDRTSPSFGPVGEIVLILLNWTTGSDWTEDNTYSNHYYGLNPS